MVLFVECNTEQSTFVLWLYTLDEECFHGEMLNSAVGPDLATALLFVLGGVPGKVLFVEKRDSEISPGTHQQR